MVTFRDELEGDGRRICEPIEEPRLAISPGLGDSGGGLVRRAALHPGGVYTFHDIVIALARRNIVIRIGRLGVERRVQQLISRAAARTIDVIARNRISRTAWRLPAQVNIV